MAELIANSARWIVASDLQHLRYSKRNIALILADLTDAGFVRSMTERNAIAYRLPAVEAWTSLLKAHDITWPDWAAVFELVGCSLRLVEESDKSPVLRRVAAAKATQDLERLSHRLLLEPPPNPASHTDAWERIIEWAEKGLCALASGTSNALGQGGLEEGRTKRAAPPPIPKNP